MSIKLKGENYYPSVFLEKYYFIEDIVLLFYYFYFILYNTDFL